MRRLGKIAYWLAALTLLSAILVSLDYSLVQAVLISLIFCPCALALEYLMPKARKPMDKVYLSLAVLVAVVVLILILHYSVWSGMAPLGYSDMKNVAPMLINPAFLGLILTTLSIGDYFWSKWLDKRFRKQDRTVTFFSDRKSVTLRLVDIAYVLDGPRVKYRHTQDLIVLLAAVSHVKGTNYAACADRTRHHRGRTVDKHVERIAVIGLGTRDKSIGAGVAHGAEQAAVQAEHVQALIVLVLEVRILADFHHAVHFVGVLASDGEIQIVNCHLFSDRPPLA